MTKTMTERIRELYEGDSSILRAQWLLDNAMDVWKYGTDDYADRFDLCREFGFAVPCIELIEKLNSWGKIVEVGAGTGYLSKLLDDCIATDIMDDEYGFKYGEHVEELSAVEAAAKHSERSVLCVWPSYDQTWAYELLQSLSEGRILLYIGEGWGGCTGDENFHRHLREHCEELDSMSIPQWPGIHDHLQIYKVNVK